MTDLWMPRLSEYLDDELSDEQRAGLEKHIATCEACTTTLEELRRVVQRAQGLEDRVPSADLWRGIAKRIASDESVEVVPIESRRPGRMMVAKWQLAAAAVVLMTLTGGTTLLVQAKLGQTPSPAPTDVAAAPRRAGSARTVRQETRGYDAAVADLERTLREERSQLDTSTIRVVEHNLWVIDQAIAQARQALATDPSSVYLNGHLAEAKQRKLELLRRIVTAIPTVQS